MFKGIRLKNCVIIILSNIVLAFGLYNVHYATNITEGGILGAILLFERWFNISPAITSFIMNVICYFIGFKALGKNFIIYSIIATLSFSGSYKVFELFPPLFSSLIDFPLIASIIGAIFIGVTVGFSVLAGAACDGDDAIAMSVEKKFHIPMQWTYLIMDLSVLLLSLTYIPFSKIIYSIITVILSGQIIGWMQHINIFKEKES